MTLQAPAAAVRNGFAIESFGCGATCFTHSDGQLTEPPKDLGEVNIPKSTPLL
jgi:hypothetical protein